MPRALLLSIRFHDGRYHGVGDWPPAPARLFQALVAGAACGQALTGEHKAALIWLETLAAPMIAAPAVREGSGLLNYVPNNDLDAVGGDPARVGEIRAPKTIRPRLFNPAHALFYAWKFDGSDAAEGYARAICTIAERLYQLGRGIDMAWARGEVRDADEIERRLTNCDHTRYRPTKGGDCGASLLCPQPGSLTSLEQRFRANRQRFTEQRAGRKVQRLFSQPPKPRFRAVLYDSPPHRMLFDLRASTREAPFAPWPLMGITRLVEKLRDSAAERLRRALPDKATVIERILIGRDATEADKALRVRIVPLPSIGHAYADYAIRRVLVEVPPNCPLAAADIAWGFSGLDLGADYQSGEILHDDQPVLVPALTAPNAAMLEHYGIEQQEGTRLWHTVTPVALPQWTDRHRVASSRNRDAEECNGAQQRLYEETRAAGAVIQALRHAGVAARAEAIRVQREPFSGKGARAEAFALQTRFGKDRLWHVEIVFTTTVKGPLVIGNGRYLGLGLMAPVKQAWRDVLIFPLPSKGCIHIADKAIFLHAARRALMSLSRDDSGALPRLFSGHEADGTPAGSGQHEHVFLASDADDAGFLDRLIVAAPWSCDRSTQPRQEDRARFDRVVSSLAEIRAGRLGVVTLGSPHMPVNGDRLIGPASVWESRTPYCPARHPRRGTNRAVVANDVAVECRRRGLPRPEVEIIELSSGPNSGNIEAWLRLRFSVSVIGPIMLGRDSHMGGGLFGIAVLCS